ncbi:MULTISPECIES: type II secretion system F family protein [unclassified Vibrio]|uniref:type II secretion system F family protein n=1 Tax=unclassified Vibrio TaxID=2614977 RepID=UPI000647050C|nr:MULTISPECIES: type II secretion system F family protein [unclassified Vibrio]NAX45379.1 type II secretion system F family protein [Vibrio sp. V25_P4S6T154]OXX47698.1 type II secretion system protein F [Vibrio sp. V17_P4S1T151]OXX61413.1 type II secretion system protein F [Vibrio sp. V15_P4S5T153]OXX67047.1 type II secretion system protein F [Vibrio sp. V20_P4S3T152]
MKQFKYVARRKDGSLLDGWLQAENEQQAKRQLQHQQKQVVMLTEQRSSRAKQLSREILITTLRELATLRESGMPLDLCINSLLENSIDKHMVQVLKRLHSDIESGSSLSEAIAAQPDYFPYYVSSMLRLGEASGQLGDALFSISERIEREEKLVGEVKSALTYPAFLLIVCVATIFFMFLYVIPNFENMVQGTGDAGALGTLLDISAFLNNNLTVILIFISAIIGGLYYSAKYGNLKEYTMQVLCLIPMFRRLIDSWNIVQFSSSMQKLLQSGVELVESVEITLNSISDLSLRKRLNHVVIKVREGKGLADSLAEYHVFPPMVIRLIHTGEAGASLVPCFREIHNLYERRLSKGLKQILTILEPLVIVIMGGIVGSIMIVLISGIISVNNISL